MKQTRRTTALLVVAAALTGGSARATSSVPVLVDTGIRSRHWSTVYTNEVSLRWNGTADATHARLNIAGMNGSFETNFTGAVSNYLWRAFSAAVPAAEDVYDLTLNFHADDETVVEALTSRVAVVAGAFGAAVVNAASNSPAWSKVCANSVIPYDASWLGSATNAVSARFIIAKTGGAVQTNLFADAAGYAGWKVRNSGWGYGTFLLTLAFPDAGADALTAELFRPMDGTAIRVR